MTLCKACREIGVSNVTGTLRKMVLHLTCYTVTIPVELSPPQSRDKLAYLG